MSQGIESLGNSKYRYIQKCCFFVFVSAPFFCHIVVFHSKNNFAGNFLLIGKKTSTVTFADFEILTTLHMAHST